MITGSDFLWFVDRTLDRMVEILRELGDDRALERPGPPQTNSPYVIASHCVGVMRWWGGHLVGGRSVVRDRAAEFVATGSVASLIAQIDEARADLARDVAGAEFGAPLRNPASALDATLPLGRSQGGALFHLYEELSQHLGQMEISRDVLLASP
jgi:hypothetical protein